MRDRSAGAPFQYRALTASNNSRRVALPICLATCCLPSPHALGRKPSEAVASAGSNQCEAMRFGWLVELTPVGDGDAAYDGRPEVVFLTVYDPAVRLDT